MIEPIQTSPLKVHISSYVEIDFPEVTARKAMAIRKSKELSAVLGSADAIRISLSSFIRPRCLGSPVPFHSQRRQYTTCGILSSFWIRSAIFAHSAHKFIISGSLEFIIAHASAIRMCFGLYVTRDFQRLDQLLHEVLCFKSSHCRCHSL